METIDLKCSWYFFIYCCVTKPPTRFLLLIIYLLQWVDWAQMSHRVAERLQLQQETS